MASELLVLRASGTSSFSKPNGHFTVFDFLNSFCFVLLLVLILFSGQSPLVFVSIFYFVVLEAGPEPHTC